MVGFMRRYDQAYRALKRVATDGSIGAPLLMHCAHRNPSVPPHFTADMIVNDSAIHEFDLVRWLFEEEIAAVSVLRPRRNSRAEGDLADPLVVLLETASGILVDVELSVNIAYGYDIRGEIVAETGTAALPDGGDVVVKREGYRASPVPADWRERFLRAYDVELQEWVDAVAVGEATGPSAWDGYAATVVAEHGLEALHSGARVPVVLRDKPEFYSK
jgi:myo-inositol 2-dehydrogenase/D-chiro-inositol 1-dehydrogenase